MNVSIATAADGVRSRARHVAGLPYGRTVVLAILYGYFTWLVLLGGHDHWATFWVPALDPAFFDLRSVTSAWECTRKGIEVLASNPCDPWGRPANYPRLWLVPSVLGLGQGSTIALGILVAAVFLGSFLLLVRGATVLEGAVYGAALVSPAVMLGVERGNADLLVLALLVLALLAFRSTAIEVRVSAHAMLLLAAMLKLFPVFAFGVLLRQPRRWKLIGTSAVVALFALYVLVTLDDIRTILQVVPQEVWYSYGAGVGGTALRSWLSHDLWAAFGDPTFGTVTTAVGVVLAVGTAVRLAWGRVAQPVREDRSLALDGFVAGAGIFVGSFAIFHNWDYRLAFLLLTIPQLIRWAGAGHSPLPAPRLTLAAVVGTLWLSEWFSIHYPAAPFEELLNWLIFVTFTAGLIVLLASSQLERVGSRLLLGVIGSAAKT